MDKIYVGSVKEFSTQYGIAHSISYSKKDLLLMLENLNEKEWINLVMFKRKEVSEHGHTHSISIDDYKKEDPRTDVDPLDMASDYPEVPPPNFPPEPVGDFNAPELTDDIPF